MKICIYEIMSASGIGIKCWIVIGRFWILRIFLLLFGAGTRICNYVDCKVDVQWQREFINVKFILTSKFLKSSYSIFICSVKVECLNH